MTTTLEPAGPAPAPTRPEDERLPLPATLGYGIQHILAMFGGVIAVPIILGGAAGLQGPQIGVLLSSCLLLSGLATVLQTLGVPYVGSQLPLVQGVSFATVSTMIAIIGDRGVDGLRAGFGATLVAGVIALLITPFFAQIVRFFPPVVTGTIITVIGLSLMPVALGWITGQEMRGGAPNPDYASGSRIALAMATLAIVLVLSTIKGTSRVAILLGLLLGTVLALVTGQASVATGGASLLALPTPFAFGAPTFAFGATVSMLIVMLVIMVETTADILAVGEVVGTKVDSRRVADGLRADMAASAIAPIFNAFPATAFAQNVGLVALTGITSRYVVAAGGVVLALLGLSPMAAALVGVIPQPVLGGAGLVLFGTVAAGGIRTLSKVAYDGNQNMIIVAVSLAFGLLPNLSGDFWRSLPEWMGTILHSGISSAAIVAVVLNIAFNMVRPGQPKDPSNEAAAPALLVRDDERSALEEGRTIVAGDTGVHVGDAR